jgi:hypothetical protein
VPLTLLSHDSSGVIGDLKVEYLGEFATVLENILGCEPVA